jgi:signal transduction histidine kinase
MKLIHAEYLQVYVQRIDHRGPGGCRLNNKKRGNPMSDKLEQTVKAIKELVQLFRVERIVYLIISTVSVLILIGSFVLLLIKADSQEILIPITGIIGSSGGIIYSSGRLLKMWSEALQLIRKAVESNDNK